MLIDRQTGAEVEVDIVIEASPGDTKVVIGIEVRDRSRPATVEWVRECLGKHATLPTHKLVLVSRSGFTKEGIKKSRQNDIDVLTLEGADDYPWAENIKKLCNEDSLTLAVFDLTYYNYEIKYFIATSENGKKNDQLTVTTNTTFHNSENNSVLMIKDIPSLMLHDKRIAVPIMDRWIKEEKESFSVNWNVPEGSYAQDENGNKYFVESIKVHGKCAVKKSSALNFEKGLYRGKEIAYASIPDIVSKEPGGGEVTLSIIENLDSPYIAALTLPKPDHLGRRLLSMSKAEEILNKET